MTEQNKIWVDGMRFERPREGAPEFIKGKVSINVATFKTWFDTHSNGREWLNIDLKQSKEKGTLYLELNTYKKEDAHPGDNIPF